MKNFFNRTLIILLSTLTLFTNGQFIYNTFHLNNSGISIYGIETEEEPFDEEDRPNKS